MVGDWFQSLLVFIAVYLLAAFEKTYRRRKAKVGGL